VSTNPPSRVRVLTVIRFPIGGIRSYLRYTYRWLAPECYEVTLLTVSHPEAKLLSGDLAPMRVCVVEADASRPILSLLRHARSLVREDRFDLIHSQGFTAGVLMAFANPLDRVPHVLTLHETLRDEQFRGPFGPLKRRFLALALSRIDRVITVGEDANRNLLSHLPIPERAKRRIAIIRSGVDVDRLLQAAAEPRIALRERFEIDDRTACLGFFGRFMPEKGFEVLVDAVGRLEGSPASRVPFKVIAFNDGAFVREYRERIQRLGIGDRFLFAGLQPSVAAWMPDFDAAIMPSLREALPLAAMEAMAMGCPLVATDCVGLREVTRDTPAIVARAGDAASLAEAIERLLEDLPSVKAGAAEFAALARKRFDSRASAAALETVFADVRAAR